MKLGCLLSLSPMHITMDSIPAVLTVADICRVLRVSRAQYYRLQKTGQFPLPPLAGLGKTLFSGALVQSYLKGEWAPPQKRVRR